MIEAIPFYGFESPRRLWLLAIIPALVVAYIIVVRLRSHHGMRYTNTTILGQVLVKQSQWLRHVIVALSVLSLLGLGLAWAQPLGLEQVPRERATVVLVIDVSMSMTATDVAPSRLDAAKAAAVDFVEALPATYNVSLVSLSGNPSVRLPPTDNHSAVVSLIKALEPQDTSAIGDAIMAGLVAIDQVPKGKDDSATPAIIVLLSDGGHNYGQAPLPVAQEAAEKQVPIYTIAFGTDNGYVDLDDGRQNVPPDRELLRQLAEITDGEAYSAENVGQLEGAYKRIHSEVGFEWAKKEITATAAGLSLIFAFVAAAGAVILGVRFR